MLSTADVQANQCSSGVECPSDGESKNLVSLLQTKLRMNVLEDGPSMMKNPSAMLTELEGMVRSGDTPAFNVIATIKNLIQNDIMPALQTTREEAANATTANLNAIIACNTASLTQAGNIAGGRQVDVETARSTHRDCREAEKVLHDHNLTNADSFCVKLGKFLHGANPLEIQDGSSRGDAVIYVKQASTKNMCDSTQVTELDLGCTVKENELGAKKVECAANQHTFESEFCAWKTELDTNCATLGTCRSQAVTAYGNHVAKTRTLVDKWNVETKALQKILCYCEVWMSEKDDGGNGDDRSKHDATKFGLCKTQTHTPPTVDYGSPVAKVACPVTSVADHPGTGGFITKEYSNFKGFVESTAGCAEATTVAPTKGPET